MIGQEVTSNATESELPTFHTTTQRSTDVVMAAVIDTMNKHEWFIEKEHDYKSTYWTTLSEVVIPGLKEDLDLLLYVFNNSHM